MQSNKKAAAPLIAAAAGTALWLLYMVLNFAIRLKNLDLLPVSLFGKLCPYILALTLPVFTLLSLKRKAPFKCSSLIGKVALAIGLLQFVLSVPAAVSQFSGGGFAEYTFKIPGCDLLYQWLLIFLAGGKAIFFIGFISSAVMIISNLLCFSLLVPSEQPAAVAGKKNGWLCFSHCSLA